MISPSALNFVTIACMVVIFSFLWRMLAARWSENSAGQAMAAIL
jgi:hypothetical protein